MVYSEDSLFALEGLNEDASVPDKEESIKPRHHKARTVALEHDTEVANGNQPKQTDDEDDEEYDEDEDDFDMEWTLRKCSAATLDVLSVTFAEDLLPQLLPVIQQSLASPSWEVREASILALGAIAEGMNIIKFILQDVSMEWPRIYRPSCPI
jgi:transportin-1